MEIILIFTTWFYAIKLDSIKKKTWFFETWTWFYEIKLDSLKCNLDSLKRKLDSLKRKLDSLKRKLDILKAQTWFFKTQTWFFEKKNLILWNATLILWNASLIPWNCKLDFLKTYLFISMSRLFLSGVGNREVENGERGISKMGILKASIFKMGKVSLKS